jgi:hypothetical protein
MATELYPSSVNPLIGYSVEPVFSTQATPTKSGADVAEKIWDSARYRISLPYRCSLADAMEILNFHTARAGKYEVFDFIDLLERDWEGLYIGTGDGSEDTFATDFDATTDAGSGRVVYVDGVEQTVGAGNDYLMSAQSGTNNRDRVVFLAGSEPANGAIVTMDYTGKKYFSVRFMSDKLEIRSLAQFVSGIEMHQLDVELMTQR